MLVFWVVHRVDLQIETKVLKERTASIFRAKAAFQTLSRKSTCRVNLICFTFNTQARVLINSRGIIPKA